MNSVKFKSLSYEKQTLKEQKCVEISKEEVAKILSNKKKPCEMSRMW